MDVIKIALFISPHNKSNRPSCPKALAHMYEVLASSLENKVVCSCFTTDIFGLECTEHVVFDLIMVDKMLKQFNALELLSILRKVRDPTPVVLLIEDTDASISDEVVKNLGFSGLLSDSLNSVAFCNVIRSALDNPVTHDPMYLSPAMFSALFQNNKGHEISVNEVKYQDKINSKRGRKRTCDSEDVSQKRVCTSSTQFLPSGGLTILPPEECKVDISNKSSNVYDYDSQAEFDAIKVQAEALVTTTQTTPITFYLGEGTPCASPHTYFNHVSDYTFPEDQGGCHIFSRSNSIYKSAYGGVADRNASPEICDFSYLDEFSQHEGGTRVDISDCETAVKLTKFK